MAAQLGKAELHRLARLGAVARLAELEKERLAILRAFPGLLAPGAGVAAAAPAAPSAASGLAKPARRRRRKMTAAEKKVASERMKKFWAERKKAG
jgi:hypothetical protein